MRYILVGSFAPRGPRAYHEKMEVLVKSSTPRLGPEGRPGIEVDLGAYLTQEYEGLFRGRLEPQLGVGLSVGF